MSVPLVPTASSDSTEHADWLEFSALSDSSREASAQDLVTALRRSGSSDAIHDELEEDPALDESVEREDDELERIGDAAVEQLERREQILGQQYPFTLNGALKANPDATKTIYAFLTAITSVSEADTQAPQNAATLFERLSAATLVSYLGGGDSARSYDFGFPRRNNPSSFKDAVDDLCQQMGEGAGHRADQTNLSATKDAKLDLVVWLPFGDGRPNQLSVFGQCATGRNWESKIRELQPIAFCKQWFREQPAMNPELAFFVPRHIKERQWSAAANDDRLLLFDRLRIAHLLSNVDQELADKCAEWTESALNQHLGDGKLTDEAQ